MRRRGLACAAVLVVLAALGLAACSTEQQQQPAQPPVGEPLRPVAQPRGPAPAPTADITITAESVAGGDATAALQAALDGLRPGQTVLFTPGEYRHADVLTVKVPDVTIAGPGARLIATDEERSAFHIDADRVTVQGLSFGVQETSQRWYADEQMKVRVFGRTGLVLRDVTVTGSAASGIFVGGGASDFTLDHVVVRDTRADGIHITGGARDGQVISPLVERSGDDGVAVVSYDSDADACRNITITAPTVNGTTWGRGISVVGGEQITYTDVDVRDTNAAGIYLAVEGQPYFTRSVSDVRVEGGSVTGANYNSDIDHGAVLIYNGRSGEDLSTAVVDGVTIRDTRQSASQNVAILAEGGSVSDVSLTNMIIEGGPEQPFTADAAPTAYSIDRWWVDGQEYRPS